MKINLLKFTLISIVCLGAVACKTCNSIGGVSVGGTYDTNTGQVGGSVAITFKRADGSSGSFTVPRSRGFDAFGKFVTLNELRALAVNAFNNPANKQPRFGELNGFDLETVGIIVKSLHENGAIRGSAQ